MLWQGLRSGLCCGPRAGGRGLLRGWSQTGAVQAPPPPLPALPLQKVTRTVGMLREHPWVKARRSMDEGASLPSRAPLRGLVGAGPDTQPDFISPGGSSPRQGVPEVCRGVLDLPWHPGALP